MTEASRGLRIFGHPAHAMLSDGPVALLGSAILWDAVGLLRGEAVWWTLGFWNIALGLAAAGLAAVAGLVDIGSIPPGSRAMRTALMHMTAALAAAGVYGGSLLARGGTAPPEGPRLALTVALDSAGLLLIAGAGWLGGHLVFHFGVGRAGAQDGAAPRPTASVPGGAGPEGTARAASAPEPLARR